MILCDAHAHLGGQEEQKERIRLGIRSLVCAAEPEEAERLFLLAEEGGGILIPAAAIHPWKADQYRVRDMEPYFERCAAVGETGMDSVWCQVPLGIQERVFREQLALACALKKPVVLHTKGQEKEIAEILKEYPNQYLVHWYSCGQYLEEYMDLDCYFSVGPDVWWNPAVERVAKEVREDRLLVETDGLGAVLWAYENAPGNKKNPAGAGNQVPETVSGALEKTVCTAARLRGMEPETAARQISENLARFLGGSRG